MYPRYMLSLPLDKKSKIPPTLSLTRHTINRNAMQIKAVVVVMLTSNYDLICFWIQWLAPKYTRTPSTIVFYTPGTVGDQVIVTGQMFFACVTLTESSNDTEESEQCAKSFIQSWRWQKVHISAWDEAENHITATIDKLRAFAFLSHEQIFTFTLVWNLCTYFER